MSKTVSEMAKNFGLDKCNFVEVFECRCPNEKIIEILSGFGFCTNVEGLRERLECAGKRCTLYAGLIDFFDESINKTSHDIEHNIGDTFALEKRLAIIQTHRDEYELMGFLTLLQMDAMTTIISQIQAQNDSERIMLSKHAYTILYEAWEHDLFKKVSARMHKFPKDLVETNELNSFWRNISSIRKNMISKKEAEDIRINLDAHKNKSFTAQIALYKKCDWSKSVINLYVLVKLIEVIHGYMDIIHDKLSVMYNEHKTFMEERLKQYEEMRKQLWECQVSF